jgi:hypothetical protein
MNSDTLTVFSTFATAIGVFIAAWQLWRTHRQSITAFEDSLAREYRELAATLPIKALLGERLTDQEHSDHFDKFYRYFDLSNEQAFLHECGRISPATWQFWRDGIVSNLKRPAFTRAWNEVCRRDKSVFSELRTLSPPETQQQIVDDRAASRVLNTPALAQRPVQRISPRPQSSCPWCSVP